MQSAHIIMRHQNYMENLQDFNMAHLGTPWFSRALEAHSKGMDHVHDFGIRFVKKHHSLFHAAKHHETKPYDSQYIPNPFRFQYDLCMFLWLNYYRVLQEEMAILRSMHKEDKKAGYDELADKLLTTRQLYDITRSDFLFAAAELRWPTRILDDGAMHGLFIRDPWSERRVAAASDENFKNVISFGGGGQGKTHVSLAMSLMIFDYFIFTQKGARCMLSTVNKDKLDSVGWAYLCNLNSSTDPGISLYAGKAKIAGDHTLARPANKDRGGVFKGILIGQQMNDQNIIDKLTGSHGHPFICYTIDEMQSTPDPPIRAAPNYTMHAKDYRIFGAGNWGENNDTLADNVKPDIGWDQVDEHTGKWVSTMKNGSKAIVLHFNNNDSPGMTEEGNTKYPHLPSKKTLDKNYPDPSKRNMNNIAYRRFWVGFRVESTGETVVISDRLVKENNSHLPLQLDKVLHTMFAFDSAPAEIDRNLMTIGLEGICSITKQRVFGPSMVNALRKATESTKYYQESSNEILSIAKKNNIISGGGVVDWTGRPAHAEMLQQQGFVVRRMIYNKGLPDGKRRDQHTGRIERAIKLAIPLDFKQDMPPEEVCAHHVAENNISFGAFLLREYVKCGRLRGINDNLISYIKGERSLEEELYNRKFKLKNSSQYGSRFHLESKDDFKIDYGFSPDLLDTLFEMAWYMYLYRNLPLTPIGNDVIVDESSDDADSPAKEHDQLWNSDSLEQFDIYG